MRKIDELTKGCFAKAHPMETLFVLLGRDPAASVAIKAWMEERLRLGKNKPTDPQIADAKQCIVTMTQEAKLYAAKRSLQESSKIPKPQTASDWISEKIQHVTQELYPLPPKPETGWIPQAIQEIRRDIGQMETTIMYLEGLQEIRSRDKSQPPSH